MNKELRLRAKNALVGGWEDLPHNLGRVKKYFKVSKSVATSQAPPEASNATFEEIPSQKLAAEDDTQETSRKRQKISNDTAALLDAEPAKTTRIIETGPEVIAGQTKNKTANEDSSARKRKRQPRKANDCPYGLTPGESPFPDWEAPTLETCEEVHRLLVEVHGQHKPPERIPAPSMDVATCGEVPSVLDALIRTRLSASTSTNNAGLAMKGLQRRFGELKEGIGAGSTDWNQVRLAPFEDLRDAIKAGGLANIKARDIKGILDTVYQENLSRAESLKKEREDGLRSNVLGSEMLSQGQKDAEILKVQQDVLSLDHLRGLDKDEVMPQLVKYPGIGIKTAACVVLFNLQQPCFAVDTHVWRLSKWLGWVPEKATRDETFSHLEVRVPDHLKYALHQLFIQEGKKCHRCSSNSSLGTKRWEETVCPLEHLLNRLNKRTAKPKPVKNKDAMLVKVQDAASAEHAHGRDIGGEQGLVDPEMGIAEKGDD